MARRTLGTAPHLHLQPPRGLSPLASAHGVNKPGSSCPSPLPRTARRLGCYSRRVEGHQKELPRGHIPDGQVLPWGGSPGRRRAAGRLQEALRPSFQAELLRNSPLATLSPLPPRALGLPVCTGHARVLGARNFLSLSPTLRWCLCTPCQSGHEASASWQGEAGQAGGAPAMRLGVAWCRLVGWWACLFPLAARG